MRGSSEPPEGTGEAAAFSKEEIEAQLARIFASPEFANAEKLKKLLSYLSHAKFDAFGKSTTEYDIAYDVLDRKPESFDPATDAIVRRTAGRLREKLDAYYANSGKLDPLIVELPNRSYEPRFRRRAASAVPNAPPTNAPPPSKTPPRRWPRILQISAAASLLSLYLLLGRGHAPHPQPPPPSNAMPARIFASSTSEGQHLRVIGAPQRYGRVLLIAPDGKKLYAVSAPQDRVVKVFRTADLGVERVVSLTSPARSGFMSRDGTRIYFGSLLEGVTVVNTAGDRIERTIHTGAPVYSLTATPDNRKLFVAMGNSGLARIDLKTLDRRTLSSVAYPFGVSLDRTGRNLYVAYQHGGPGGRPGHDVVEVYDTQTESVLYAIKDLPMVGAEPLFAPRDEAVLLNMSDACFAPYYDRVGCPGPPSGGYYLWDPVNRRVLSTQTIPKIDDVDGFLLEGTRLFFAGQETATVRDWARQQILEKIKLPGAPGIGEIVFLSAEEWAEFSSSSGRSRTAGPRRSVWATSIQATARWTMREEPVG